MSEPVPSPTSSVIRPRLRGVFDIVASVVALPSVLLLVAHARPGLILATAIYGASLVVLLVGSAVYHLPGWPLRTALLLRKVDHANIYLLIAGSATPICALMIPGPGLGLALAMWCAAAAGILKTLLWSKAPRQVSAAVYVAIGVIPVPFARVIGDFVGEDTLHRLLLGGVIYIVGAVVYALRWPNPAPFTFGYHEIFHLFVFAGAAIHFAAIWGVVG
ncbi:MAG: hemolysin III family protein [Nannocystaceae bacterium]